MLHHLNVFRWSYTLDLHLWRHRLNIYSVWFEARSQSVCFSTNSFGCPFDSCFLFPWLTLKKSYIKRLKMFLLWQPSLAWPLLPGGRRAPGGSCSGRSPRWQPGADQGRARPGSGAGRSGSPAAPGRCRRRPGTGRTSWRTAAGLSSSKWYRTTPAGRTSASCCRWCSKPKDTRILDLDILLLPCCILWQVSVTLLTVFTLLDRYKIPTLSC